MSLLPSSIKTQIPFIGFLLVISAFVIYKLQHLGLPYFWDEAWSYAPAVSYMRENGLGLLPGAMPPDISRGHPLLFYFLAASWAKIFGNTVFSLHVFILLVSLGLLSAIYYLGSRVSGVVGLSCVLLICLQPVFLAQAGLLLPEVLLTLWIVLSIIFWLNENKLSFICTSTCLLLTKESGIIFLLAIGVWILVENFLLEREKLSLKNFFSELLIVIIPVMLASVYFIIQKIQYGWFFYPEHMAYIKFDWHIFKEKYWVCHKYIFEDQARKPLSIGFLIITIALWKELKFAERLIIGFCFLAVTKIFNEQWSMPKNLEFFAIPVLLIVIYRKFFFRLYFTDKWKGRLIGIISLFAILFVSFSALNFLSIRYLLCVIPLFLLGALIFTQHALASRELISSKSNLILMVLVAICGIRFFIKINEPKDVRDDNLNFVDGIKVQQDIAGYFKNNGLKQSLIYGTFLNEVNLTKPVAGYISEDDTFLIDGMAHDSTAYFIFTNIEDSPYYKDVKKMNLTLAEKIVHGKAWGEIYKK